MKVSKTDITVTNHTTYKGMTVNLVTLKSMIIGTKVRK